MAVHGMHGRVAVCLCGMGSAGAKAALMMRGDGVALISCEVMTAEKVKDEGSLWSKLRLKNGNWNDKKIRQEAKEWKEDWREELRFSRVFGGERKRKRCCIV